MFIYKIIHFTELSCVYSPIPDHHNHYAWVRWGFVNTCHFINKNLGEFYPVLNSILVWRWGTVFLWVYVLYRTISNQHQTSKHLKSVYIGIYRITTKQYQPLHLGPVTFNRHQPPPTSPSHLQQAPAKIIYLHSTLINPKQHGHHHPPPANDI